MSKKGLIVSAQIANGGNSKSFWCNHIAWYFSQLGYSVLLIDADSIKNASTQRWYDARKAAGLPIKFDFDQNPYFQEIVENRHKYDLTIVDFGGSTQNIGDQHLLQEQGQLTIIPVISGFGGEEVAKELAAELKEGGISHRVLVSHFYNNKDHIELHEYFKGQGNPVFDVIPKLRSRATDATKIGEAVPEHLLSQNKLAKILRKTLDVAGFAETKVMQREQSGYEVLQILAQIKKELEL